MASKTVIYKAYCRFASPICDYLLFNRKKYKVNYYPGMKDMQRDIDTRSCNICNYYCNMANLAESIPGYWTWIILHPTAPGYLLHRPCYHLVLFLSGIVLYRFWIRGLVFELPSWGLHVLLRALQSLARSSAFPIKEYAALFATNKWIHCIWRCCWIHIIDNTFQNLKNALQGIENKQRL